MLVNLFRIFYILHNVFLSLSLETLDSQLNVKMIFCFQFKFLFKILDNSFLNFDKLVNKMGNKIQLHYASFYL